MSVRERTVDVDGRSWHHEPVVYIAQYMQRTWSWTCTICGICMEYSHEQDQALGRGARARAEVGAQKHYANTHNIQKSLDFFELAPSVERKWYVE